VLLVVGYFLGFEKVVAVIEDDDDGDDRWFSLFFF
jgi:hypothetical protein